MKLWGGRFSESQDALAAALNNSLAFDYRLGAVDARASMAWARALGRASILSDKEVSQITAGLETVLSEITTGTFEAQPSDEDIHTAVERRLVELAGPVGGKLHTGRSRNDQVATDFRMWLLAAIEELDRDIVLVQAALVARAENDMGIVLPGYTHLQRAQPILLSHWWLGHFWPLQRDRERLRDLAQRTNVLPLGSAALAGTSFPIDRLALAADLGFTAASENSLDAVSDRDFAVEFLFCASLISVHLSRLAEMLILYASSEFGFIELADAYSTGSSLMPQKKNPDPLELTRGKAGTMIGLLTGLLAAIKSTPSAYDKDLQEDKQPVFQAADLLGMILPVVAGCLDTLAVNADHMKSALDPAMLATDLADYLVAQGVPFRQAHALVGQAVRKAGELGLHIDRLPLSELAAIDPAFGPGVIEIFDVQAALAKRNVYGGTAPEAVVVQLKNAKKCFDGN